MCINFLLQYLLFTSVSAYQPHQIVRVARSPISYQNVSSTITSSSTTSSQITSSFSHRPLSQLQPTVTTQPDCTDSTATYTDYIYPTLYVTVTSGYDVSISASGDSPSYAPTILETPAEACYLTVVPKSCSESSCSESSSLPAQSRTAGPPYILSVIIPTSGGPTSTITVTKKTPIPVVDLPPSDVPPVTFNAISPTTMRTTTAAVEAPGVNPLGSGGDSHTSQASLITTGSAVSANSTPTPDSITQPPAFSPTTITIAGATLAINPDNIVVTGSTVTIPTGANSQTTFVADGQSFTILQSQIIGLSTTYLISLAQQSSTYVQSASMITVGHATATIGPAQVVISGTTYHVGTDAQMTSVVVDGQTISIGPSGVGDSSITFSPPMTIVDNHYELVVVKGLTVSVDASEAVISGTKFKIGVGATSTVAIISGSTVTLGPSGVVLSSTTIAPTSVPSIAATKTPPSTSSSSSGSKSTQNSGPTASSAGMATKASASRSFAQIGVTASNAITILTFVASCLSLIFAI